MNRQERRAQTRDSLLDAAAEVFASRGFHAATVDDVAAAAGYTKGAVYSNFAGKDALFLALLDRHLDAQFAQMAQLFAHEQTTDLRDAVARASAAARRRGPDFGLLTMEFWLYALRDPAARAALAERYTRMRARLAELIAQRHAARGTAPARPPVELAALVLALDAGLFLQQVVDPQALPAPLRTAAIVDLLDRPGETLDADDGQSGHQPPSTSSVSPVM